MGALVGADEGAISGVLSSVNVTGFYNPSSPSTGLYIGGLVGYYDGSGFLESASSGTVSGYGDVGGLIGHAGYSAAIQEVTASGDVHGVESVGGLIGANDGIVVNAVATGNVTATGIDVGGLVGSNTLSGEFYELSASGSVSGAAQVGGFAGANSGYIDQSFAAGPTSGSFQVGGFVGDNASGSEIQDSYALGAAAVSGSYLGSDGAIGGFAGENAGEIDHAYSTGMVTCTASDACAGTLGGFIGQNDGAIDANSFWDVNTSGISSTNGVGTDNTGDGANVYGETTATLQSAVDNTWDTKSVWGIVPGVSYPYLQWQTNGYAPQVISGTTVAANGSVVSGLTAAVLLDGSSTAPLVDMNSGANGYYYVLLAPDTIYHDQVLVYLTNGAKAADAYIQNDNNSILGLTLKEGQLRVRSSATDTAAIFAGLDTALGSASGSDFLYSAGSGFDPGTNFYLNDSAADFTLDTSIDLGSGQLTLTTAGSDTQTAGIITASWLRGSSAGGASFDDTNEIGKLGAFSNTGSGGFALTDGETLKVQGAVAAGTGDLSLTTTGTGSSIGIASGDHGRRNRHAEFVRRYRRREIVRQHHRRYADRKCGWSGRAQRCQRNRNSRRLHHVGRSLPIDGWSNPDVGGTVNSGSNTLALQVTSGDLDIDDALDGKSVVLSSTTDEIEGAGAITANFLNVSANTGIDLTGQQRYRKNRAQSHQLRAGYHQQPVRAEIDIGARDSPALRLCPQLSSFRRLWFRRDRCRGSGAAVAAHERAGLCAAFHFDPAVMQLDEAVDERKSKSCARALARTSKPSR